MMHSKVMVIDDRFLRIGSANLNNRSMGTDTECDLAIEAAVTASATDPEIRDRLHRRSLRRSPEEVAQVLASGRGLLAAAQPCRGGT